MTGVVRIRELVAFRWMFFILLLLGVATALFDLAMMLLFDHFLGNDFSDELTLFGLACFCSGGIGLIATQVIQRGHFVKIMRWCSFLIIALWGLWIVFVWLLAIDEFAYRHISFLSPLAFCSIMTSMVVIAAYILSLETKSSEIRKAQRLVSYSLVVCTLLSFILIWFEKLRVADFLLVGLSIWWTAILAGIVGISLALRRENKPARSKLIRTIPRRVKMKMTCPQCHQWLEAISGSARCDECGLRMIVEITEPRCLCGYLLYELKGNVCPECGRDIEQHASTNTPLSSTA